MTLVAAPAQRVVALRAPVAVAAAAVSVAMLVALVDPNEPGHYPTCPFLALTGHPCPGCGSLRALHALAHGDLAAAVGRNLLVVAAVPLLGLAWARWTRRAWGGRPRPSLAHPAWVWTLLVVVLGFWLLRNLPFAAALAP
jgi:hypothetical protein